MPTKKWHPFEEGAEYDRDEVVSIIERHHASGEVETVDWQKDGQLEIIRACPHARIKFAPTDSWARSPMNSKAWVGPDGNRLS